MLEAQTKSFSVVWISFHLPRNAYEMQIVASTSIRCDKLPTPARDRYF